MPFIQDIQADSGLFEYNKAIQVADSIILTPILIKILEAESLSYLMHSRNDAVKKYLPFAYVESHEEAQNKLMDFAGSVFTTKSLFYCIRLKEKNYPLGYIHLNSPLVSTGLKSWSVTFWLGAKVIGNGIMSASLSRLLVHLKEFSVKEVLALVEPENHRCIRVLERVGFIAVSKEETDKKRLLYRVKLT